MPEAATPGGVAHSPTDAASRGRPWIGDVVGWLCALAVSVGVVAWTATTSDWLMFTDGDSVIVSMIARSIQLGQPQEWAMSPVLFLPETAIYLLLSLFGLGMRATLALNGVVNLLLLYGAIRLVAGPRRSSIRPVAGAVLAFVAFGVLVLLEGSAALPGLQLATLMVTTTYYSTTVVAAVASVGLVRRALDGERPIVSLAALGIISAVSVLTNPLFAVWTTVPAALVVAALAVGRRIRVRAALQVAAVLVAGAVIGYLARTPFAGAIVATDGNYIRVDRIGAASDHFGSAFADTAASWHGLLWIAVLFALTVACAVVAVGAWRRGDAGRAFVAGIAVLAPIASTVGTILIGTDADRYIQPWVFLPILVLAISPPARTLPKPAVVASAALAGILVVAATPVLVGAATRDDSDLDCVVDWVQASERTGAGQFWTVRAPKAHLDDPTRLVQVDNTLRVYEWLTNRIDTATTQVSFLVKDAQSVPFALPAGLSTDQAESVACGRYTILDFGDRMLPLGPPRS